MKALKTAGWSVAKLRLADVQRDAERRRQTARRVEAGGTTMGDLTDRFVALVDGNSGLAAKTKVSTHNTLGRLVHHWRQCFGSDLRAIRPDRLTRDQAAVFSNFLSSKARFSTPRAVKWRVGYSATAVNKTLQFLHRILRFGVEAGAIAAVPFELKSATGETILKPQPHRRLHLPSGDAMRKVFRAMRTVPDNAPADNRGIRDYLTARAAESADLAEFMAFAGARLNEAVSWTWEDERSDAVFIRGTKTRESRDREVPKIAAAKDLLRRMRRRRSAAKRPLTGRAFSIGQCREALATACKRVGVETLTHHSLRHLFATTCIEAGVDIPTVSRWLGHADGGYLCMKTYGHLRREHSVAQAKRVHFGGGL
jgi:integrase